MRKKLDKIRDSIFLKNSKNREKKATVQLRIISNCYKQNIEEIGTNKLILKYKTVAWL